MTYQGNNPGYQGAHIRTTISSFTIQDESGLLYKFAHIGLTKVLKTDYCDINLTASLTQPTFKRNHVYNESSFDNYPFVNPYIVNDWYLTEIDDALVSGRKILLSYSDVAINSPAGTDISYNAANNYSIISHKTSICVTPEISTITCPDGHGVSFNYGLPRFDLVGALPLTTVDISYQARPLSEYQLNNSYIILNRYGTPTTPYEKSVSRLVLLSIKKVGVDLKSDEPPYLFDYYLGSAATDDFVPPPFFYKKDIWGYYNGDNSTAFDGSLINPATPISQLNNNQTQGLCFLRPGSPMQFVTIPKSGYAKNGLLRQIVYPEGGALTYTYAQNQGVIGTQPQGDVGGVHVSQTNLTDGGYSNGCTNPLITQYNYVLDANNTSSLWGVEQPINYTNTENPYIPDGYYAYYKFPSFINCDYHYKYPGILSREDATGLGWFQQFMQVFSKVADIVGAVMDVVDVINVCLDATPANIIAVIIDEIAGIFTEVFTCLGDFSRDNPATVYFNFDLNAINPLPSQFSRVEVVNQNSSVTGKTVSEFTCPASTGYAVWQPTNPTFSLKQRFAYWAYGLPQITSVYDAGGVLIDQTENDYDYSNAQHEACTGFSYDPCDPHKNYCQSEESCKCYVTISSSKRNTTWSDPNYYNNPDGSSYTTSNVMRNGTQTVMAVDFYNTYTGRVNLAQTKHRVYKKGDPTQFTETVEQYGYDLGNYQVNHVATTQSNGDIDYKDIVYSDDFCGSGYPALNALYQNNILEVPVTLTTSVVKNDGTGPFYLGETITEFTTTATGDIKPASKLEERTQAPAAAWTNYTVTSTGSNASSFKQIQALTYDANDNLIGLQDEGSHVVSNIYGYKDKYIIASVINANPLVDKPAYTSFENQDVLQDFGESGWTLHGTPSYITNITPVTGTIAFGLNASNSISATLNTLKPYRLSFWANNSSVTVTGATLVKSAPAINGFIYYEYNIAQNTASVTVAGTATIDELRLYPSTARMRTITYDPLIGKTSECDENNRITYYEYDELGRERFIKDENRNITKMYEYNIISNKLAGCPATYSNHAASESFTKQGCTSGYVGSSVTYSVAAGKYTSSISQLDADMQLEADLMAHGQAYANSTGTCLQVFYNAAQSGAFTTHSCAEGYVGGTVTYNVPAGKYSSTVDQATADQMAIDEVNANGQAYANSAAHAVCTIDNTPDWEASGTASTQCQTVGSGLNTGHLLELFTDINPNSSTYNTTMWEDAGMNTTACPVTLAFSGTAPNLSTQGYSSKTGNGYITGTAGSSVKITVTLNSSDGGATLTGNTGGASVNLSGSGTHTVTNTVTIPASGYLQWSLTISGTITGSGYISSNISITY